MPYLGVYDEMRREIRARGYVRKDLSDTVFKISPRNRVTHDLNFVNVTPIVFSQALTEWGLVHYLALFDDVDTAEPDIVSSITFSGEPILVREGDRLLIKEGRLLFPIRMTGEVAATADKHRS